MDPLITAGNNAAATVTDNNVSQTQANNASYASANPNIFGTQNSTQPVVMSPTQAFNNNPINVPSITAPDTSGAIVAGANSTVDSISKSLTPAPTPLDNQQQGLLNDIANLTGTDAGKGDESAALNDKYGVNTDQQALVNAQNELASKTAHYNQLQANLGGNGAPETSAVLAAQNSGLLKAQASDIGITNAKITAAQGNLQLAQQQVANAINLKYGDIEAKIKTKQAQLDALAPSLNKQQQTQALAQQKLLSDQAQKVADEKATATSNVQMAVTAGVNTKFVNKNGQFFDTNTGVPFASPADFFKAAGVSSFEEAYQKGLVSDLNNQKMQDINFAQQAQAKYPDVKIPASSTPEQVQQIIKGSRIYSKETYIAPPAGGGGDGSYYVLGANPTVDAYVSAVKSGNGTLANVPANIRGLVAQGLNQGSAIVDPTTDQQVRAIIAANPGEYGHAADAINKIQPGLASKYDNQLKAVYNDKQDVGSAFNATTYSPLAGSRFALEATRIAKNFIDLPQYQLTANGLPYLQRIQQAIKTPGSISDQELLDGITKLSTSGNAVTDAQIKVITQGQNYSDKLNVFQNKFKSGGVLSDQQRQDLLKTATDIYDAYSKGYQPVYDQVTKQLSDANVPQSFWTIPDLNSLSNSAQGSSSTDTSNPQEGQTGVLNGVTYKFTNGQWISQ